MGKDGKRPSKPSKAVAPKRRMSYEARHESILSGASEIFAEHGFRITQREVGNKLGVAPGLLYEHFASKEDLINEAIAHAFHAKWDATLGERLVGSKGDLESRVIEFYKAYLQDRDRIYWRMFLRSCLDGLYSVGRYQAPYAEYVVVPMVRAVRQELGLPSLERQPLLRGEYEAVSLIHAQMVYVMIRCHLFETVSVENLGSEISQPIKATLPAVIERVRNIHDPSAASSLDGDTIQFHSPRRA